MTMRYQRYCCNSLECWKSCSRTTVYFQRIRPYR